MAQMLSQQMFIKFGESGGPILRRIAFSLIIPTKSPTSFPQVVLTITGSFGLKPAINSAQGHTLTPTVYSSFVYLFIQRHF